MPRPPARSAQAAPLLVALALAGCDGGVDPPPGPSYEDGCIAVTSASQGFAHVADAIEVAEEGDTVTLCAGTWEQAVVLDKAVALVGEGPEATAISWQDRGPAVSIRADGASLSGVSVTGWEEGVLIQDSPGGVVLEGVRVHDTGDAGVRVSASGATLDGVVVTGAAGGGVYADLGSDLEIAGSTFDGNAGWGVYAEESSLRVSESSASGTEARAEDGQGGIGFYVDTGVETVRLDDVVAEDNEVAGILWYSTAVEVERAQVAGGRSGVYGIFGGPSAVRDSVVSGAAGHAVYLMAQDAEVRGTAASCTGDEDDQVVIALSSTGGSLTVADNQVSGFRGVGVAAQWSWNDGYDASGGTATVVGNHVTGGTGFGMVLADLDSLVLEDNVVEGVHWSGDTDDGAYADGVGARIEGVPDARLARNTFQDQDIHGIEAFDSAIAAEGDRVTRNGWTGVHLVRSTLQGSGLRFEDGRNFGAWLEESSAATFDGCTFARTAATLAPEYWDLPPTDPGFDLNGGYPIRADASTVVFRGGVIEEYDYYAIRGTGSDVTVEDATITAGLYGGPLVEEGSLAVRRTVISDPGTFGIRGYPADMTVEDATVTGATSGTAGAAVYNNGGDLVVTGSRFEGNYHHVEAYPPDGRWDAPGASGIHGNEFGASEDYAVRLSGGGPDVSVADNTFACTARCLELQEFFGTVERNAFSGPEHGVFFRSYRPADGPVSPLVIRDNTFDSMGGRAIYGADFQGEVLIEGNEATASGQDGIRVIVEDGLAMAVVLRDNVVTGSGAAQTADSVYVSGSLGLASLVLSGANVFSGGSGDGLEARYLDLVAEGGTYTGNSGDGMYLYEVTLSVKGNPAISDNGSDGIYLGGATSGDIVDNTITGNAGRGIYCYGSAVVLDECQNAMADNALGDLYASGGCLLPCSVAPEP